MPTAKLKSIAGGRPEGEPSRDSKYRAIFEQASDAIATITLEGQGKGKIDAVNRAFEEMTGFLRSEIQGGPCGQLVPQQESNAHRMRALSAEMFETPGTYEDVAIRRKDGYTRFVDLSVRLVEGDGRSTDRLALALFRDVTEKKQMERELITKHTELRNAYVQLEKNNAELQSMQETLVQSGKLAALGELAAGIAHELNQPLMGIRGYAQELQAVTAPVIAQVPQKAEIEGFLKEIISNADKMSSIIRYLRDFTRKSTEGYELADVHVAIEESLKMLSRQFASRGIEVKREFDPNLPKVYAIPLQLEQVFINLATNARDAIESTKRGQGVLSIKTKRAGKFVEVTFRDDGIGMSERTKAKAFNPFFTTKEVGKGMGLGLSLSFGILSKIQGSIMVESELGKGAAFTVRIPTDFRELA